MSASTATVEAVSGAIGSVLALLITYPLKTVSTLQALETGSDAHSKKAATIIGIIRKYRLSGLYTGIETSIVDSASSSGAYFYLYSLFRHIAVSQDISGQQDNPASTRHRRIGVVQSLLVAALAGAGNQLLTLPLSVITTQTQAARKANLSVHWWTIVKKIYAESGLSGFWAGLVPALILVVNPAIQYMFYEQLLTMLRLLKTKQNQPQSKNDQTEEQKALEPDSKQAKHSETSKDELTASEIFVASALAKLGATALTYPMIVVKSRLQATSPSSDAKLRYNGPWDAISSILHNEGIAGFFKGFQARLLTACLNAALMQMLKEQLYSGTADLLRKDRWKHLIQ